MDVAHQSRYRLGELPLHVVTIDEGARAYIDTRLLGRVELFSGDWVQYDAGWQPIGVVRKGVMDSASGA